MRSSARRIYKVVSSVIKKEEEEDLTYVRPSE